LVPQLLVPLLWVLGCSLRSEKGGAKQNKSVEH
jgi:hypothetical protein